MGPHLRTMWRLIVTSTLVLSSVLRTQASPQALQVSNSQLVPAQLKGSNDVLIVSLLDGHVVALDQHTGRIMWTFDSGAPLVSAKQSLSSSQGLNVFPGTDGGLYAYHGLTHLNPGLERLPISLPELVEAAPSLTADGSLILGRRDSKVFLLDKRTGRSVHTLSNAADALEDHSSSLGLTMGVPPDELLFVGRQDYVVRSVRMDTKAETWNATFSKLYMIPSGTPGSIKTFLQDGLTSAPTSAAAGLPHLVVSSDNSLQAFDPTTHLQKWYVEFPTPPVSVYRPDGLGGNALDPEQAGRASLSGGGGSSSSGLVPSRGARAPAPAAGGGWPRRKVKGHLAGGTSVLVGALHGSLYALPADHLIMAPAPAAVAGAEDAGGSAATAAVVWPKKAGRMPLDITPAAMDGVCAAGATAPRQQQRQQLPSSTGGSSGSGRGAAAADEAAGSSPNGSDQGSGSSSSALVLLDDSGPAGGVVALDSVDTNGVVLDELNSLTCPPLGIHPISVQQGEPVGWLPLAGAMEEVTVEAPRGWLSGISRRVLLTVLAVLLILPAVLYGVWGGGRGHNAAAAAHQRNTALAQQQQQQLQQKPPLLALPAPDGTATSAAHNASSPSGKKKASKNKNKKQQQQQHNGVVNSSTSSSSSAAPNKGVTTAAEHQEDTAGSRNVNDQQLQEGSGAATNDTSSTAGADSKQQPSPTGRSNSSTAGSNATGGDATVLSPAAAQGGGQTADPSCEPSDTSQQQQGSGAESGATAAAHSQQQQQQQLALPQPLSSPAGPSAVLSPVQAAAASSVHSPSSISSATALSPAPAYSNSIPNSPEPQLQSPLPEAAAAAAVGSPGVDTAAAAGHAAAMIQQQHRSYVDADGAVVIGRLRVGPKELGFGSAGTIVYEGVLDSRPVAVKRLLRQFYNLARKEINVLVVSDEHPNVVRCFAMEEDREFVYLALERCKTSLAQFINDQGGAALLTDPATGAPTSWCMSVLSDTAEGLAALHARQIVHRDLKPHNVLLTESGRAKLSDMGLSKQLVSEQSSFESHGSGGSSGWQAPEQLIAKDGGAVRQSRAVDVFSLGCIMFYCLSGGKHPFGEHYERDTNIIRGLCNLTALHKWPEAVNLLSAMLSKKAPQRPTMAGVLRHPFWWNDEQRLQFLVDVSDRVENEDREPDPTLLNALESYAAAAVGSNWGAALDVELIANLGRYRRYDYTCLRDLLRVVRNKRNHFREMPESLQQLMGPLPNGYYRYFSSRFPTLLLGVFFFALHNLSDDPNMAKYFAGQDAADPGSIFGPFNKPWDSMAAKVARASKLALAGAVVGDNGLAAAAAAAGASAGKGNSRRNSGSTVAAPSPSKLGLSAAAAHQLPPPGPSAPSRSAAVGAAAAVAGGQGAAGAVGDPSSPPRQAPLWPPGLPRPAAGSTPPPPPPPRGASSGGGAAAADVASSTGMQSPAGPAGASSSSSSMGGGAEGAAAANGQEVVVGYHIAEGQEVLRVVSFPSRPGKQHCDFFVKTGHCKFGSECVFDHPAEYGVPLTEDDLPFRPGQPVCTYYYKTRQCKYGASCKFHHPKLIPILAGSAMLQQ